MHDYQTQNTEEQDVQEHSHKNPQADHQLSAQQMPQGVGSPALRQAQILQLQRTHGNKFVQRMLQRDPENTATADADTTASPSAVGQSTPIGDGSVVLSAQGGVLNIQAASISGNAALTDFSGVVRADTVIADTVMGSSYTPGAGNVM